MTSINDQDRAYEAARAELAFIRGIDPRNPGALFRYSQECFASYCNMQANSYRKRWPLIAHDMLQVRDTAYPAFRSIMRDQGGWHVDGDWCQPYPFVD